MQEQLFDLLAPTIERMGYELVHIEYLSGSRPAIVRIYIDSEKGIGVDDCSKVSHQVAGILDVEDPIPGQYTLEVSSPGLNRPLVKESDYVRFCGQQAKLKLQVPLDGRRHFKGVINGSADGVIQLEVDGEVYDIPMETVESARLAPTL